ncbi:N-acetylmuramoyl-L-alanine amidase AmiA precursor [Serratia odorifera]|uniref:N-acetylmuramoyl-L-alanine amidase n=1 Tax=Serratia odorifera TaxID=618 RepID=A0A3S5D7L4_SEROD|nr:N-acetylmuramoyl-L-alanine amidase AmiA precursor [Serratia odorifera]
MKNRMNPFRHFKPLAVSPTRRQLLLSGLALALVGAKPHASQAAGSPAALRHNAHGKPAAKAPGSKRLVMIDPGHGGIDSGAVGHEGSQEKHVVLEIANHVRRFLQHRQLDARLTREEDEFIPLYQRVEIAHQHQADLFISIHADGFTSPSASGASVFCALQPRRQQAQWPATCRNAKTPPMRSPAANIGNRIIIYSSAV